MSRYILQPSDKEGYFVCTDQENKIVCVFENHNYNENQEFRMIEDFDPANFQRLAEIAREMGDWLRENHYDKIF